MRETEEKTKTTRKMERKRGQTPRQETVYSKLLQGFFPFPCCCVLPRRLSWPRQFLPIETIKKNDTRGREIEQANKKGGKHVNGAPKDSQLHLFCLPPPHPRPPPRRSSLPRHQNVCRSIFNNSFLRDVPGPAADCPGHCMPHHKLP